MGPPGGCLEVWSMTTTEGQIERDLIATREANICAKFEALIPAMQECIL